MSRQPAPADASSRRPELIRAVVAAALLVSGLLLPWNVHFGLGITATMGWVFAVLVVVTLLSLSAVVVGAVHSKADTHLRLALNVPYLMVAAAFTLFTIVISIRYGGKGVVEPGVGPGAWAGVAGALLAAQPAADANTQPGARAVRIIGWLSIGLATLAALANLYFRTRYVVPGIGGEATAANLTTAVAAVLYSAVALLPVLIVGRWILSGRPTTRLATVLLGSSAVLTGALIWILPVGRELDAFHGIAQNTGTAGVGYEGYLAWVAVAAIAASASVRAASAADGSELRRNAIRSCLMLIAVWCAGMALLRIVDVVLNSVLDLPAPPYNSTALMAFDVITAVLALWLFVNTTGRGAARTVVAVLLSGLFALTVCRLVLGVALVPKSRPLNPGTVNAVYGNELYQQITSTFDMTLSVLTLALLGAVLAFGDRTPTKVVQRQAAKTAAVPAPAPPATADYRRPPPPTGEQIAKPWQPPRVADVLAQSTQRFGAGTTYSGPQPTQRGPGHAP